MAQKRKESNAATPPSGPSRRVPWSVPDLGAEELEAVRSTFASGWLGMGPVTQQFEQELSRYTKAPFTVVVNNGTSALLDAYLAHGIGPGDVVLVPTYTFIATASAAVALGARIGLIDCDPSTLNVTPETVRAALRAHPKPKAIVAVDVAGLPCDLDALRAVAQEAGSVFIEDAAEAFGGVYRDQPLGSLDHTTIFSFHIAKQLTSIEGGAVQTHREGVARRLRLIRSHGEGATKYWHEELGLNLRPTDVQSALGRVQLAKVDRFLVRRDQIARKYLSALAGTLSFPPVPSYATRPTWMIFLGFARDRTQRDALNAHLRAAGIDTRLPWPPVHQQPYFRARFGAVSAPNADAAFDRVISLPIGNAMRDEDVDAVIAAVHSFSPR